MSGQVRDSRSDSVLSELHLPMHSMHHPLGFPVELATNCADVVMAAHESWGPFSETFSEPPIRLCIEVREVNSDQCQRVPIVRWRSHLLSMVADSINFASCDMKHGFGFACLTSETTRNRAYLRYYFLEAMAYTMLQSLYLTPIHAACVALSGHGVLLCGDSEAGKSSLAYACAREGWTYISDDASYLIRTLDSNVVIGNPHRIRLRESAPQLFPELHNHPVRLRARGDRSIEVATASQANLITAQDSSIDYVIFLKRQISGAPRLVSFPKQQALRWFESLLCIGESDVRAAQTASLHRLLSADVLQFRYSELAPAVAELKSLIVRNVFQPAFGNSGRGG
jgi:hypothetical protein